MGRAVLVAGILRISPLELAFSLGKSPQWMKDLSSQRSNQLVTLTISAFYSWKRWTKMVGMIVQGQALLVHA